MKLIEILNDIDKGYGLIRLVKASVVPCSILSWRDIYLEFDVYIKTGNRTSEAVRKTADKFNISEGLVYKIKKKMES